MYAVRSAKTHKCWARGVEPVVIAHAARRYDPTTKRIVPTFKQGAFPLLELLGEDAIRRRHAYDHLDKLEVRNQEMQECAECLSEPSAHGEHVEVGPLSAYSCLSANSN